MLSKSTLPVDRRTTRPPPSSQLSYILARSHLLDALYLVHWSLHPPLSCCSLLARRWPSSPSAYQLTSKYDLGPIGAAHYGVLLLDISSARQTSVPFVKLAAALSLTIGKAASSPASCGASTISGISSRLQSP
ncbi:hypothetical protein EVG20_g5943 [Dentipellis fragilis]|uniref:Uncharacterized protein n=1 Tax=Dentipellis fragilis TaxID=205917 RepID=A0A4Y9YRM6_9AGAM|nr:hypothetical protein EVG20_g5943 [Dentipellis fragilis]